MDLLRELTICWGWCETKDIGGTGRLATHALTPSLLQMQNCRMEDLYCVTPQEIESRRQFRDDTGEYL